MYGVRLLKSTAVVIFLNLMIMARTLMLTISGNKWSRTSEVHSGDHLSQPNDDDQVFLAQQWWPGFLAWWWLSALMSMSCLVRLVESFRLLIRKARLSLSLCWSWSARGWLHGWFTISSNTPSEYCISSDYIINDHIANNRGTVFST